MKRIVLFMLLILVCLSFLAAKTEKIAVIGFDKEDRNSSYIQTMLEKKNISDVFAGNSILQLMPLKESQKMFKEMKINVSLKELEIETVREFGTKINVNFVLWGWIQESASPSVFNIECKIFSLRSGDIYPISFTVTKNGNERDATLRTKLVAGIEKIVGEELKKIFTIAEQNYTLKQYDTAESNFNKVLDIDEKNSEALYYLGMIYYYKNNYHKAIEYYISAINFSKNVDKYYVWLSETYTKSGDIDKSIETLESLATFKNEPDIWLTIANGYKEKGNLEKAEIACDKALLINPDYDKAHFLYANLTYDNKDYDKAIPHLEFLTNQNPDDEELGRKLAISYQKTNRLDKAIENYQRLIQQDPNNSKAYLNLASAYRAISLEKEADKYNKLALDTYLKVKTLLPDNPKINVSIADIYLSMNDLNKAEEAANASLKSNPDLFEAHVILGMIYQKRGIERFNAYIDLQKQTDSGNLYGKQLDQTIAKRDQTKASANTFFKKADEFFKLSKGKTDKAENIKDIDSKIQSNQQYINQTSKGFF